MDHRVTATQNNDSNKTASEYSERRVEFMEKMMSDQSKAEKHLRRTIGEE